MTLGDSLTPLKDFDWGTALHILRLPQGAEEEGGVGKKNVYSCLCESVDGVKNLKSVDWESRGSFMNDYVGLEKPIIVRNFVKKWAAAKKWTQNFS